MCEPLRHTGCGTGGCAKVVGIMFELAEDPDTSDEVNEFLENIFSVMPTQEGVSLTQC